MSGRGRVGKDQVQEEKLLERSLTGTNTKKDAKVRKLEESAKSSMDLKAFFSKKEVNQPAKKQEPSK